MQLTFRILIIFLLLSFEAISQQKNSTNGVVHTPKGHLHILTIFVGFKSAGSEDNHPEWKYNQIPAWAQGKNNEIFNSDTNAIGSHNNLSKWYKDMSLGKFLLTGDIFPEQIMVKKQKRYGNKLDFAGMNKEVFSYIENNYPEFNWGKYDNRDNRPDWAFDNSEIMSDGSPAKGDQVIDFVLLIYRNLQGKGGVNIVEGGDFEITTQYGNEKKKYYIARKDGYTGRRSRAKAKHFFALFLHEFAHNLYNAPHVCGANGVTGKRFFTNYGWGMITNSVRTKLTTNAWERWYLGWAGIKHDLSSVKDNGVYKLNDFITSGDAIRLRLPNTKQHLWLENHQGINEFDTHDFPVNAKGDSMPEPEKGLTIFAEDLKYKRNNVIFNALSSKVANKMKFFHARGNYDYSIGDSTIIAHEWWGQEVRNHKIRYSNPLSGQNRITFIRDDYDENGKIKYDNNTNHGDNEQKNFFIRKDGKKVNGPLGLNMAFQTNSKIGLSNNPAPTNIQLYNPSKDRQSPVMLNNLSIEVLSVSKTGQMKIKIKYDDPLISQNVRWAGELQLKNDTHSQHNKQMQIIIDKEKTMILDRNYTSSKQKPVIHKNGDTLFSRPTSLMIRKGTILIIKDKAKLLVKNGSSFIIRNNADLIIKGKGRLIIGKNSYMHIAKAANIILKDNESKIIMKESSDWGINPITGINTKDDYFSSCSINDTIKGKGRFIGKNCYSFPLNILKKLGF